MGLSSFKFLWWAPNDVCNATERIIAVQGQFMVIQGRWFRYQSKARICEMFHYYESLRTTTDGTTILSVSSLVVTVVIWSKCLSISMECIRLYPVNFCQEHPRLPWEVTSHDYKLIKRHCRSHARLAFFSFRVVTLWDNLPSQTIVENIVFNV